MGAGGPCVMRPTGLQSSDGPAESLNQIAPSGCFTTGYVPEGECGTTAMCKKQGCTCEENGIAKNCRGERAHAAPTTPWSEDLSTQEKGWRHNQGFNNQFAFPWETGFYWKLTTEKTGSQRAIGCPGLDEDFKNWPFRNMNSPIWHSPAMQCEVNDYAADGGRPAYEIVDEMASDNAVFTENFLEGWQQMISNGYTDTDLADSPHNGWLGYYSLSQQGYQIGDFEAYISDNAPVDFTDPTTDPWICGHRGHATTSCGYRFSRYYEIAAAGGTGCTFHGENGQVE